LKKIALEIEIRVPFMTCQQPYELIYYSQLDEKAAVWDG
jgi:hypothetical protein